MVKVGQRYQYLDYPGVPGSKVRFIAEVVKVVKERVHDVKIVQIVNWGQDPVGYVYTYVDVSRDPWFFLEGQDAPEV